MPLLVFGLWWPNDLWSYFVAIAGALAGRAS
jgi:hypothetical protein